MYLFRTFKNFFRSIAKLITVINVIRSRPLIPGEDLQTVYCAMYEGIR